MRVSDKARLCAGTATLAFAIALNAAPAAAQCATATSTVTCTGTVAASTVNTALAGAPAPSVTLRIESGTTVTRDTSTIQPSAASIGTVDIGNAGTVGTDAAPVGFTYFGSPAATTNILTFNNSGTFTGQFFASGVGGAMTVGNTGTLSGGLSLFGSGDITLTSSGPIYVSTGAAGTTAVQLQSFRNVTTTTGTAGTDGVTTNTSAGGAVTANITSPVAIPAVGTTAAVPQAINMFGIGGARLTLNAVAGTVAVRTNTTSSTNTTGGSNTSTVAGTTTTSSANTNTAVGGVASATLGTDARVASLQVNSGPSAANASIAGSVGSAAAPGAVTVASNVSNFASTNTSTINAASNSSANTNSTTQVGGSVGVDLASTGLVFGGITASSSAGAAAVTIAGTVGAGTGTTVTTLGNVSATSIGTNNVVASSASNTFATGDFTNASTSTNAASGSTAAVTLAATGNVFGAVSTNGDGSASVDNAGRIRNNVTITSGRNLTTSSTNNSSRVTTPGTAGAATIVNSNGSTSAFSTVGGTTSLVNRAGAVIEDNVSINGLGNATIDNSGAIFGSVSTSSTGNGSTSSNSNVITSVNPATPGAAVATTTQVLSSSNSNTPIGGTVTGTYSGSVGTTGSTGLPAFAFTVSQNGQAGSTATISGVMLANFTANAGATGNTNTNSTTTTTTTQPFTAPATPASSTTTAGTSSSVNTVQAANNTVTVTGALRNNGFGTGNLTASTQSGSTNVTITGGTVEGTISANAGGSANFSSNSTTSSTSTVAATAAGPIPALIPQASTSTSTSQTRGAAGTSNVALTGATIGGGVNVFGRGNGAGTVGASATISADSTVTGFLSVSTNASIDQRNDSSTVNTRTGTSAITQTNSSSTTSTVPTAAGSAAATIAGRVGGASVFSQFGNSTVALTGQIVGGNINVSTGGTLFNQTSDSTFAGTSTTAFTFPTQRSSLNTNSSTFQGGTAALTINSSTALQTAGTSAVTGFTTVSGVSGSTLSIGAGSRTAGGIFVGFNGSNSTFSQSNTFSTTGVQTGSNTINTSTRIGGPAAFTNAGTVLSGGATVQSIGGASFTNSGTLSGGVTANALGINSSTTSVVTGLNDSVLARTVATTVDTGVGGAASVTNSGVINGAVGLAGATGTATNTGVLRNGLVLGQAVILGTTVRTDTATGSTTAQTAPGTRLTQVYTVNQNALLVGGASVTGATVADGSIGAAATATLRTSDIAATINLNSGSVTTGNITAQTVSATDNTRLTNTTLRLNDTGFLGVGSSDVPVQGTGTGAVGTSTSTGPLRFVNTPNYATFAAIDSTLGNSASGTFVPSTFISNGSQITGVTLVEKTGAGSFTLVGLSYRAPSAASPLPFYTMDVGTLRVTAGELQLGVSGADPVTGAAIFGIRGNVENNGGTLLLGRRVTDGATTVVQGTNVRVDGNFTQAAAGTISIVATPTLVRSAGTVVGALPAQGVLGFGGFGVGLTPYVAYNPATSTAFRSSPSTLTVNGNATLAGTVTIAATPGAIYAAGRNYDLLTVNGTYTPGTLTLAPSFTSPFVRFALTPRTVGTSTVVSVDVVRTSYATATNSTNSAAAAVALEGTIPSVVTRITAIPNPNAVTDVQAYGQLQDLATVIGGLDTQVSAADATRAFAQLSSGSVYGSLSAIQTTSAFGEAPDSISSSEQAGVGLWFRPSGTFARFSGSAASGAGALRADTFGGSFGVNIATGSDGDFGFGGGYGRTNANDRDNPSRATANTYMLGVYGHQRLLSALDLSAQAVFGWSNWTTTRALPLFSRTATATFDSREFRINARVGYDFHFRGIDLTPFAKIEARNYRFASFEEQGAGGIGLAVAARDRTVLSPEIGARLGAKVGVIYPFVEGSYIFQNNVEANRAVSYLGDRSTSFQLQGVNPTGYAKLGAGITANYYGAFFSLRGNYQTGNGNDAAQLLGGLNIRF